MTDEKLVRLPMYDFGERDQDDGWVLVRPSAVTAVYAYNERATCIDLVTRGGYTVGLTIDVVLTRLGLEAAE